MGSETFDHRAMGATAQEAFERAVKEAQYDYGHAGYTGTIAEKDSFEILTVPDGMDPDDYADACISYSAYDEIPTIRIVIPEADLREDDVEQWRGEVKGKTAVRVSRSINALTPQQAEAIKRGSGVVDDKWGPAGAIDLGDGEWLFFGWASS